MEKEANKEEKFPSRELAYEIAMRSYDLLTKRHEVIDAKIQSSLTVGLTLFVALCTFAKFKNIPFNMKSFIFAAVFIILSILINLYSRVYGEVQHIDPGIVHKKWIEKDIISFQVHAVYFAGEAYQKNKQVLHNKWLMHITSLLFYSISILLLILWLALHQS
jgi:hypothetical protein